TTGELSLVPVPDAHAEDEPVPEDEEVGGWAPFAEPAGTEPPSLAVEEEQIPLEAEGELVVEGGEGGETTAPLEPAPGEERVRRRRGTAPERRAPSQGGPTPTPSRPREGAAPDAAAGTPHTTSRNPSRPSTCASCQRARPPSPRPSCRRGSGASTTRKSGADV